MGAMPGSWGFIWRFANRGTLAEDSDKERIRKAVVTLVTTAISGLAVIWGSIYLAIGYPWAGSIPFIYAVISFFSILYFFAPGFPVFSAQPVNADFRAAVSVAVEPGRFRQRQRRPDLVIFYAAGGIAVCPAATRQ